jgi:hypothetical protein
MDNQNTRRKSAKRYNYSFLYTSSGEAMAKAQNQTMTMLCRAFLSIMCAFIAKTTPKNLSHAINVRDKILATSELTEKRKEKQTVNRGTKINNDRCIST